MRKFVEGIVAVVAVWCGSSSVWAATYVYEDFDYSTGQLQGKQYDPNNAAWIWQKAGPADPPSAINVASGNLSGPVELQPSVGNSLAITGIGNGAGSTNRLWLGQASATPAPTIYYSFLLRVDSLGNSSTANVEDFLSFNNTANAAQAGAPTVRPGRVAARVNVNDSSKFDLGIFTNHAITTAHAASWSSSDPGLANGLAVGTTHFIVGAINFTATTNNLAQMWINPDPVTFGLSSVPTPTRTDSTATAINTGIQSLLLRQNTSPFLTIDELRVASTWAEVTPIGGTPTYFWDIDASGATAGAGGATPSGTWDGSTTNWNNSADGVGDKLPWVPAAAAVFSAGSDATGAYSITVTGTQSASTVTFEDGTPTLTGGTLSLAGIHTITAGSGVTATIDSVVAGSAGLIKEGAGTLVLTGSETYSGATSINSGTLQLGNGGTTGALPAGSAITTSSRLTFNRSNAVTQGADFGGAAIAGIGGLTQAGSGTLTLNAANTFSGTTRASTGTILLADSLALQNSTLDLNVADAGTMSLGTLNAATLGGLIGSRSLVIENASNAAVALSVGNNNQAATYTGALSGSGNLTKIGTGVQTLSGNNIYRGGTAINAGTFQFAKTLAMPSLSGGGDYNSDNKVDAADYVLWRKNPGAFGGAPGYGIWRSNFGASGVVTVNNGGSLAVNAGGTDEWTASTDENTNGTIGSLIKGRGGQAGSTVTWMNGSTLAIDTSNAGGAMTYTGIIGGFRTAGGGTTNAVGFTKRGTGTLTLDGNHTFTGPLSLAPSPVATDDSSTLILNGTALGAGTAIPMAIPTVSIGNHSTLQIAASERLPAGSLITTQTRGKLHLNDNVTQTIRSLSATNGIIEVGLGRLNIVDQAGDDYTYGVASGAYIQSTDGVFDPDKGTIYKTGAGSLNLMGDAGLNFKGTFFMENGTLKLSRNTALGNIDASSGRLVVKGGQLARSNAASGFTYATAFVDLHVFRYDLGSDSPNANSQFNADTLTTLKQDNVEFNITNTESGTGRFIFLGDIRNHDPNPAANDDTNAIRGITKTGNGVLQFNGTTSYLGATTIMAGTLLVDADATIGDYNQATIATINLKGGAVGTTTTRTVPIRNPIVVDGSGGITHISTTAAASTAMEFSSDSIVGTSGTLTITNGNTANNSATVFRPTFTGSGFNFGLPIVVSDSVSVGTGVKSNELQGGNATGTQTFSGVISGGGSFRRVNAGGTTVLSGNNTYTGSTSVDAGILSLTNPYLADTADVLLLTGGILNLDFPGIGTMDTIDQLFFDGVAQAIGTWGATGSGATNINDTFFTGDGMLVVSNPGSGSSFDGLASVPEPSSGALMFLAASLLSAARGRSRRRTS